MTLHFNCELHVKELTLSILMSSSFLKTQVPQKYAQYPRHMPYESNSNKRRRNWKVIDVNLCHERWPGSMNIKILCGLYCTYMYLNTPLRCI